MAESQVGSDTEREKFCRRLSELLGIDSGPLIAGELQAASLADGKYLLMLSAGDSKSICNLLLTDSYSRCGPKTILAHEALGVPDAGGIPYYDTSQGMPGWRWNMPVMSRDSATRLVNDISSKLVWMDGAAQEGASGPLDEEGGAPPGAETDHSKGLLV